MRTPPCARAQTRAASIVPPYPRLAQNRSAVNESRQEICPVYRLEAGRTAQELASLGVSAVRRLVATRFAGSLGLRS